MSAYLRVRAHLWGRVDWDLGRCGHRRHIALASKELRGERCSSDAGIKAPDGSGGELYIERTLGLHEKKNRKKGTALSGASGCGTDCAVLVAVLVAALVFAFTLALTAEPCSAALLACSRFRVSSSRRFAFTRTCFSDTTCFSCCWSYATEVSQISGKSLGALTQDSLYFLAWTTNTTAGRFSRLRERKFV